MASMTTPLSSRPLVDGALALAALTSAALLAGAHAFERFGGLAPCALCLDQREAHWTALAAALVGLGFSLVFKWRRAAAAAVGACSLIYLVSSCLAFYHAGVEFKFWPGPKTCAGAGAALGRGSLGDILDKGAPAVSCSDAAWTLFGVSMAGYNLLISAGLFALCLVAAASAMRDARLNLRRAGARKVSRA
jgi:disulfide bond formation protein DsbB